MKQALITQFNLHHHLYKNVLNGFTDQETNQRLQGYKKMNHVKYLAGHLLHSQYGIALLADVPIEPKWSELFAGAGQSEAKDDIAYPSIEKIKAEWDAIYDPIRKGLDDVTPEFLNQKPPAPDGPICGITRRILGVLESSYSVSYRANWYITKRIRQGTDAV